MSKGLHRLLHGPVCGVRQGNAQDAPFIASNDNSANRLRIGHLYVCLDPTTRPGDRSCGNRCRILKPVDGGESDGYICGFVNGEAALAISVVANSLVTSRTMELTLQNEVSWKNDTLHI